MRFITASISSATSSGHKFGAPSRWNFCHCDAKSRVIWSKSFVTTAPSRSSTIAGTVMPRG